MYSEPSDEQKREMLSLFECGQHAFDRQSYNEALADFSKGLHLYESSPTLRVWRGITLFKLRLYEEALLDMSYLLEHDTEDTSAKAYPLSIRGAIYCGLDRHEESLADFTRAIELEPWNPFLFIQRGMIFDLLKRFEETLADLTRAIELGLHDPVIHEHQRLLQAMLHGDEQHLLPNPQADLQAKQQSLNALTLRLVASTRLIEQRYSRDYFDECDVLAEVFARRAETEHSRDRLEEMVLACTRAIELGSFESIVFYLRGYILTAVSNQDEQVLFDWKYARAEVEMDHGSLHRRGKAHLRLRHYQEARADFELLIQKDYSNLPIYLEYTSALLHLRHYQEALSALDDAFKMHYENEGWIPFQRAHIYKQTGRENEFTQEMQLAIKLGRQIAQATPHDQRLAFNLALYLLAAGQQQEARERYARVLAQKPSRKHLEMAIEDLENWLETQPSDAFARTTLASIHDLLSQFLEAETGWSVSQGRAARAARSHEVYT